MSLNLFIPPTGIRLGQSPGAPKKPATISTAQFRKMVVTEDCKDAFGKPCPAGTVLEFVAVMGEHKQFGAVLLPGIPSFYFSNVQCRTIMKLSPISSGGSPDDNT